MDLLYRREGFPEEGELVICEVTKVYPDSVFCNLIEYDKSGMIHISEVSPGRIRNLGDYVRVGKIIVCKVLSVNSFKNQIDISLRRVSENQRRIKTNLIKLEQKAEKIIELAAIQLKVKNLDLYDEVSEKAFEKYDTVYAFFEEAQKNPSMLKKAHLPDKTVKALQEQIIQKIKPPSVTISGAITIRMYSPDGAETIRDAFSKIKAEEVKAIYLGGGTYKIEAVSMDYKTAEDILEKEVEQIRKKIQSKKGFFEFKRQES